MPISPTDPPDPGLAEAEGVTTRLKLVPGTEVAIHWLELAGDLTQAQAAAAARLMLEGASAEPLGDLHVAVGTPERGLTPVALAPLRMMRLWVADDPDIVMPAPFLIPPPEEGLVRHDSGAVPDYRGQAVAFSAEPELAALMIGGAPVRPAEEGELERGLERALAAPALNLRQGAFARRRRWKMEAGAARRVALLAAALVALTLLLQLAAIMRYSFAADRLEAEAAAIAAATPAASDSRPGFAPLAALLFDAVRAVPNVELSRIDYRPDGSLSAIILYDSPATLAMIRARLEAGGVTVETGAPQGGGGRPGAELVLRPA